MTDPLGQTSLAYLAPLSVPGGLDDGRLAAIGGMAPTEGQRAAARELGQVFFTQLIAALRRTLPGGIFPRLPGRDVYESLFDSQLAEELAADDPLDLVERLAPAGGAPAPPVAGAATPSVRSHGGPIGVDAGGYGGREGGASGSGAESAKVGAGCG
jgi:hypothetical protein